MRQLLRKIAGSLWVCLSVVTAMPAGCGRSREDEQASRTESASTSAPTPGPAATATGPSRQAVPYGDLAEHAPPAEVEMVSHTSSMSRTQGPTAAKTRDPARATWPQAVATIADGSTLKIHCLPFGPLPPGLRPAPAGRQYLVLDLVAENLTSKGVELQPARRFRLEDGVGTVYAPMPESSRLAFPLTGRNVVPASSTHRLQLLYLVPGGQPMRLLYRGRETTETIELGTIAIAR